MESKPKVLVVEDKAAEREALVRLLRLRNFDVIEADSAAAAMNHVAARPDVVITDLRLAQDDGVDLLAKWKQARPETPFVVITAYGEVDSAVRAMKLGAADYLSKPVQPEELMVLLRRCVKQHQLVKQRNEAETSIKRQEGFEAIVGASKAIRQVIEQARRAALAESTVLVTGESGTGKELVAQAIHRNSRRRDQPFVTVNMAAVPENLVESELFGHAKGSFTGASQSRIGRFEAAHNGTLFIDEIGDFVAASQAKLLRVLETQCVTPVGSNETRQVDVRVVAATSRDLVHMVDKGDFRDDLFYRLSVINLRLPALRERPEDVPMLVRHFLREKCKSVQRNVLDVDEDLMDFLTHYPWPGNVRQLANCLESMVVLCSNDALTLQDVPEELHQLSASSTDELKIPADASLEDLEWAAIEQKLDECDGNRVKTAEALGISVRTLQRKLKAKQDQNG